MAIHPTAIIDPRAELDSSVSVGPFSIIEADVKIAADSNISSNVRVYKGTEIGKNNRVDHGTVLGCVPQDLSFDPAQFTKLIIGANNVFREGVNISRGSSGEKPTTIGDNNYFMAFTHAGHDCSIGDHNIFVQSAVVAGHVSVGNHALISGVAAVHQFCSIGDYSMTAGCAKVVKDVPPYAVLDGNPATLIGINVVGLKRAGFSAEQRSTIKQAYQTLYKKSLSLEDALDQLEKFNSIEVDNIIRFYRQSKRGVTSHR